MIPIKLTKPEEARAPKRGRAVQVLQAADIARNSSNGLIAEKNSLVGWRCRLRPSGVSGSVAWPSCEFRDFALSSS
jgi:hypothetical protein